MVSHRSLARGRVHNPEFITKIVSPGEFFGFKALMKGTEYPFFAKALKDSEIYSYSKELITGLMNGPNNLVKMVLSQMSHDLENYELTSQLHYLASVQERIAFQLVLLAEKFGTAVPEGLSLNLRLTRNELAQMAGTINESLSRHLTEFKNERIIDVRGKEIVILDLPRLKERSGNYRSRTYIPEVSP